MPAPFPFVLNAVSSDADALAGPLRSVAAEQGAAAGEIAWLSPERAFDLPFLNRPREVLPAARALASDYAAEINVVPAAKRRKMLLVADMESTMVDCECLDELADFAGLREKIAALTQRAMRGELDFESALRERVALLKGLPAQILERVYRERVRLNSGARELVATMRAHGAHTMLMSGGFGVFAERVAAACGFDEWRANALRVEDGVLTGEVAEPILGREAKVRALEEAAARRGVPLTDALAIGDGANDIAMVTRAGLGVGFRPKPLLAEAAGAVVADLRSVLYLQGYQDHEIVSSAP